jgi:cytosine/adenosine deaminase-related metal-dependent hydrolase
MSDKTRVSIDEDEETSEIAASNMASEGVAAGGAVGTAVGASIGAILAIGTAVAIPGIGWVAGPILAALAGGGAGAVTGGALGGLIGLGIPESNVRAYEEALRRGGIVLGVAPHSDDDASHIQKYFEEQKADNIVYA